MKRLRELRDAAGLSQKALAEKAGVDQSAISHIERGTRGATRPVIEALAKALGVQTGELFTSMDTHSRYAKALEGLSPEDQRRVVEAAEAFAQSLRRHPNAQ